MYRLKKTFYDNFMLLQNIFGYIRAKNYVQINVFKKGIKSVARVPCVCSIFIYLYFTF
jgi:hypothetical protein